MVQILKILLGVLLVDLQIIDEPSWKGIDIPVARVELEPQPAGHQNRMLVPGPRGGARADASRRPRLRQLHLAGYGSGSVQ